MSAEQFRLADFSILVRPPGDWLMAALHAYLDNSGDELDGKQTCVAVGGYLAALDILKEFESGVVKCFG